MRDNQELSRFERHVGDEVVFATYRQDGKTLIINYVEAPESLRGTGEAGKLMADIMAHAQAHGLKIYPVCSYAVAWMRRHGEYQALLAG